jgi:tape measure domain-containing protein
VANESIGKIFVELDLDTDRYTRAQQRLYKDATTTSLSIEDNFKKLGIKTSAEFDLMRAKVTNAYEAIKRDHRATANDIVRAEEAKIAQLRRINDQQYGAHVSMTDRIRQNWMEVTAAMVTAYAAFAAGKRAIDASLQMEKITTTMGAVTSSATLAAREIQYVREESERLGLVFADTSVAFAKFNATTRNTSIEGEQTRRIFSYVAEAATALKLSGDEVNGVFLALGQMMSKGKVQAEELRGQLGERLPGAFKLAAEAMGASEAELNKMLEDGKVLGTDLLPKLAEKLHETYGKAATEAAKQGQAEINRFNNAVFESKAALGTALMPALLSVLSTLKEFTPVIKDVIGTLQFMAINTGSFFDKFGVGIKSLGYMFDSDAKAKEQALLDPILKAEAAAKQSVVDQMMGTTGTSSKKSMLELSAEQKRTAEAAKREADALAKMGKKKTGADTYANTLRQVTDETKAWKDRIAELNPALDKEDNAILKLTNDADTLIKKLQDQGKKGKVDVAEQIIAVRAGLEQGISYLSEKEMTRLHDEYAKMVSDEADWGMNENERAANAILAKEEEKLQKLAELWARDAITNQEYYDLEAKIHANSIAAKLDKDTEYARKRAALNYDAIQDIKGMEEQAFGLKMELIDAEAARRVKDGADAVATDLWVRKQKEKALVDYARKSNSITMGIKAAWYDLYQSQLTWGEAAYTVTVDLYRNMGDAFGDSFYDVITGDMEDLSDVWDNAWKSMLRSMTDQLGQMVAQWLLFNTILSNTSMAMGGGYGGGMSMMGGGGMGGLMNLASMGSSVYGLSGLLGGGAMAGGELLSGIPLALSAAEYVPAGAAASTGMLGGAGSLLAAIPGWGWALGGGALLAGLFADDIGGFVSDIGSGIGDVFDDIGDWFHEGGVVGETHKKMGYAPAYLFHNAPRFHKGLAADEFPAILQKGETVIPKGKAAAASQIAFNPTIVVQIGDQEFEGYIKSVSDGVVVERGKRSISATQRVYG